MGLDNPEGVISLPTGKTPEYFIKWTNYFIKNWDLDNVKTIRKKYGLLSKINLIFLNLLCSN